MPSRRHIVSRCDNNTVGDGRGRPGGVSLRGSRRARKAHGRGIAEGRNLGKGAALLTLDLDPLAGLDTARVGTDTVLFRCCGLYFECDRLGVCVADGERALDESGQRSCGMGMGQSAATRVSGGEGRGCSTVRERTGKAEGRLGIEFDAHGGGSDKGNRVFRRRKV
jgi:hypothetical protein